MSSPQHGLSYGMLRRDHLAVNSKLEALSLVQQWFREFCEASDSELAWVGEHFDRLNLALAEGFTNAVRHAHEHLPPETPIDLDLSIWRDRIEIRIWDRGQPFNPDVLKEPTPGELQEGGYGWFLLRRLADNVVYQRSQDGRNCLWIVKYAS